MRPFLLSLAFVAGCALAAPQQPQQYQLERAPIVPSAPKLTLPKGDPTAPVGVLWVVAGNAATSQADADKQCNDLIARNNTVLAADTLQKQRYALAACIYKADYTSTNSGTDLNYMVRSPEVKAWREQYGGSLAQFIGMDGGTCGYAYMSCGSYGKDYCHSYVTKGCAYGNLSSVHEMGHNEGLAHDQPNQSSGLTPYAFGFCSGGANGRDPMVYPSPCAGAGRQLRFGNPNLIINGQPFGDATHNGAQVLRDELPKIALFYPLPTKPVETHNAPTGVKWSASHSAPKNLRWSPQ